jgi:hypothetical protein
MPFLITADHGLVETRAAYGSNADAMFEPGTNMNGFGVTGPSSITTEQTHKLQAAAPGTHEFRMYQDGDSEEEGPLTYSGRYLGDPDTEDAFEPLVCFGAPNAGCVRIEYLQADGTWSTL